MNNQEMDKFKSFLKMKRLAYDALNLATRAMGELYVEFKKKQDERKLSQLDTWYTEARSIADQIDEQVKIEIGDEGTND